MRVRLTDKGTSTDIQSTDNFWKEEKQLNLRSTNFKKALSRP